MDKEISVEEVLAFLKVSKAFCGEYKKRQAILRRIAKNLIGDRCQICGTTQELVFHQKYGKKHPQEYYEARLYHYIENYADFAPLCQKHHRLVHEMGKSKEIRPKIRRIYKRCSETALNYLMAYELADLLRKNVSNRKV